MEEQKPEVIYPFVEKYYFCKSNNRRNYIYVIKERPDYYYIKVETKRLTDKKERKIVKTVMTYSIDTFALLTDVFGHLKESGYWNKNLHRFLSGEHYNINTNIEI